METSPSRTIFLTGASSGIGAAIARILLAHGHQVFATARREEALEQVAQEAMAGATGNGRILTGVMDESKLMVSGGSAGNTAVGLAGLGARSAYVGKVKNDALGQAFKDSITQTGATKGRRMRQY